MRHLRLQTNSGDPLLLMKKRSSVAVLDAPENGAHLNGDEVNPKQLLAALTAFKRGDFSVRLPDDWTGVAGKVAETFNDVIAMNQRMAREQLGDLVSARPLGEHELKGFEGKRAFFGVE